MQTAHLLRAFASVLEYMVSSSNVSMGLLLNEKEQEVARLREQALASLESKVNLSAAWP